MFAFDPTHRLSIPEILSHSWMNGEVLCQQELEQQMRKIENSIVEARRKAAMKNLKGRNIRGLRQNNRSAEGSVDLTKGLQKGIYRKELTKLTDRFVPVINNYQELEGLLGLLEGDLNL